MSQPQQNPYLILVDRYIQLLKTVRPDINPIKSESSENRSRLSLQHCLWMLNKMKEPNFKPLTSYSGWINWIISSLYMHGIIDPDHEIDIMREIHKQYQNKHEV